MANSNGYGQPPDLPGLENMLHQFRVNELQMFLAAFKIAKLGKKNELVDRARQLLYQQRPPNQAVINKIREIHTKRFVTMQQPQPTAHTRGSLTSGMPQQSAVAASHSFLDAVGYQNSQHYVTRQPQYVVAPTPAVASTNRARDLRMVELPFYEHLHTIVEPTELLVNHSTKSSQDMFLSFSVPEKFVSSVSYRSEAQPLPRIELQLRFFMLDLSSEQKDDFPPNCTARIDDQPVQLPNIIPTNKPNVEAKRPSRSVNITPYCQPPRYGLRHHRLQVTWTADKRVWAVSLSVVRRLTSEILLKRLRNNMKMHRAAEHTKRMIIRRLGGGSDGDDIAMDSLRVSLLCPLGKIRMTLPTKPTQCEHLQCFDASLFLMMNEKKPTWKCPVCDNPARYADLVVDGYFEQVLNEMNKSVTEVELLVDGTWKAVESDDGDDSDSDYASPAVPVPKAVTCSTASAASSGLCAKNSHSADDDDIIVLDDSDDEPTSSTRSSASQSVASRTDQGTATMSSTICSSAQLSNRLRPSPCSPTQSEGGSSASDPSVICIDLADSSSSPPSRPGTGEANRASSSSTSLPYMQRTASYSPSTPGYEPMTPPVPQPPPTMVSANLRRPINVYSGGGSERPYKRMAMDTADDGTPSSLQLPTVSMQHMVGYSHAGSSSTPSMVSTAVTGSYGQPATYQQHSYHQQPNSGWMNNYQASVAYPQASLSNGYYNHHNGFDVATSSSSMNGMSSYHPSANMFNSSALPDFANVRVSQELQAFLSSLGMQQPSNGGVPFNHG